MSLKIPTRKTDNKSAVIARDFSIFDAPVIREKEFDYDDYKGVIDERSNKGIIDDRKNRYNKTKPIVVEIIRQISRDNKN